MAVDDLWYRRHRGADNKPFPSSRHGRGKRWRVRWIDPETGGKREQLFERKADAERYDATTRADISRGTHIDVRAGQVTVADYAAQWRTGQLHDPSTASMVERAFRLHIVPLLGDLRMAEVRPSHVRRWVKDRAAVLAPSTLTLTYGYLKAMFTAAVTDRVLGVHPCVHIQLPQIDRPDRYIPTAEQVHALAAALPERYRAAPYLTAGCGLRPSEVFGLELDQVNFLRREVTVSQQIKRSKEHGTHIARPKTVTSKRTVELPELVGTALARHLERHPPVTVDMDDRTDPRGVAHRRPVTLLFATSGGTGLHRSAWSPTWQRAVARTDLPTGFGMHGLRHYFATLLIHNGASVKTVQLALGHSTPATTMNAYLHEWPDSLDRTRSLVDEALGTSLPPSSSTAL